MDHWIEKLSFLADGCISLTSFGGAPSSSAPYSTINADTYIIADPSFASLFQNYHGMIHVHSSPSPHTLLPPSHKLSVLRGLSSSSNQVGGGGENNLAFRCTRKRFIVETLHLDAEGGVGERRTTAASGGGGGAVAEEKVHPFPEAGKGVVDVQAPEMTPADQPKPPKPKKRVTIKSDAPEFQF